MHLCGLYIFKLYRTNSEQYLFRISIIYIPNEDIYNYICNEK